MRSAECLAVCIIEEKYEISRIPGGMYYKRKKLMRSCRSLFRPCSRVKKEIASRPLRAAESLQKGPGCTADTEIFKTPSAGNSYQNTLKHGAGLNTAMHVHLLSAIRPNQFRPSRFF